MAGWIKLHRDIQNHWIWEGSEVTYFQAWTDLLLNAAHKPHKQLIKKQVILLESGQVAWSDSFMCARWKWSRNKVRLFIKNLKKDEMIETNTSHNKVHLTSIITICNYSTYQESNKSQGTAKGTTQGTAGGIAQGTTQGTQDKNVKNDKNISSNNRTNGFKKPSIDDIKIFLQEKNITSVDAEKFFYHYESNGWMRGKTKIKSWKACVNTWRTNNNSNNQTIEKQSYKEL